MIYFWTEGKVIHKNNTEKQKKGRKKNQPKKKKKDLAFNNCTVLAHFIGQRRWQTVGSSPCVGDPFLPFFRQEIASLQLKDKTNCGEMQHKQICNWNSTKHGLTVYSPCFFPYHFIHFLNSLSILWITIDIVLANKTNIAVCKANQQYPTLTREFKESCISLNKVNIFSTTKAWCLFKPVRKHTTTEDDRF